MDEPEKMDESVKVDNPDIEDYKLPHSGVRRRQGGGKMRSGLIATEFIPSGTHLAYHLTQDVDLFVNATSMDTTGVWEAFSVYGAGNVFLQSMIYRKKSKPVIEDPNDRLWDFRFINDCELEWQIRKNFSKAPMSSVILGPVKKVNLPLPFGITETRALITVKDIKAGEEIFWNYKYHMKDPKDSSKCTCGIPIENCRKYEIEAEFAKSKKKKLRPDPVVEKVYADTKNGTEGGNLYLVKHEGYDEVCNEFVEEETVHGLDCYKKYKKRKDKRIAKEKKGRVQVIGTGMDSQIENADDSSGDEDEDARATARQSAPKEVFRLDRERIKIKKRIMERDVVYALHTNQEMMRHDLTEFKNKYPQLLVQYLKEKEWIDEEREANLLEVEHNNNMKRTKIRVSMKGEEELIKRCIECQIPNCRGHKASKQTLLQHYITHCGILYAQTYNQNQRKYMLSASDERALLQIKLAISTKDFDRIKLESYKLSSITILKAAKLVGKKYDIPDLRDIMTTGLGFSQDYLNELQSESSVDEIASKMDSMKILKDVPTVRCEISKAIFADYNGMTAVELLQLHKQNKHTDNVIGATYFKRRIEPGYCDSIYCPMSTPNNPCNVKCGGQNGEHNIIQHLKISHPFKVNKIHNW